MDCKTFGEEGSRIIPSLTKGRAPFVNGLTQEFALGTERNIGFSWALYKSTEA
jgi:hypothetical protein